MNQVIVAEKKKQTVLDGRFFKSLGMSVPATRKSGA
jgi:hypothetical protein